MSESNGGPKLRIIFDGVIAVGPAHPSEGDQDGPLFGVMAHSTRRQSDRSSRLARENPKEPSTYIPVHVPTVFTKLAPQGRPPDEVFQKPLHSTWYLWHPVRERMEFQIDGNSKPGTLTYDRRTDSQALIPDRWSFFDRWDPRRLNPGRVSLLDHHPTGLPEGRIAIRSIDAVPDAREIWRDRSHLLRGMLDPGPKVRQEVAAQVFVPFGEVAGGGVDLKGKGTLVKFDPPRRGCLEQKTIVPNIIVTVPARTVNIRTYSLDTGHELDPLVFNLEEDAEIWISNGDPTDMAVNIENLSRSFTEREFLAAKEKFGEFIELLSDKFAKFFPFHHTFTPKEEIDPRFDRRSEVDLDFELFFTLLEGENDNGGLPVPLNFDNRKFDFDNCFGCQVETREQPRMLSAPKSSQSSTSD